MAAKFPSDSSEVITDPDSERDFKNRYGKKEESVIFNFELIAELRNIASIFPRRIQSIFKEVILGGKEFMNRNRGRVVRYEISFSKDTILAGSSGGKYKDFKAAAAAANLSFPSMGGFPDDKTTFSIGVLIPNTSLRGCDFNITTDMLKVMFSKPLVDNLVNNFLKKNKMSFLPIPASCGYGTLSYHLYAVMSELKKGNPDWKNDKINEYKNLSTDIVTAVIDAVDSFKTEDEESISDPEAPLYAQLTIEEVWPEDVQEHPGLLYYTGVHAMMLDEYNKLLAPTKPLAKQRTYMNTRFFANFEEACTKREVPFPDNYKRRLQIFQKCIDVSVKGPLMSREEKDMIDSLFRAVSLM